MLGTPGRKTGTLIVICSLAVLRCQALSPAGHHAGTPDNCELILHAGSVVQGQKQVDAFLRAPNAPTALEGAIMNSCTLRNALAGKDIRKMKFLTVNAAGADLNAVHAEAATFSDSDLSGAQLSRAHLEDATFNGQKGSLAHANLSAAYLAGASFLGSDMQGVDLTGAVLTHVRFEARTLPDIADLAEADSGLETLRAPGNPVALNRLRKEFSDMGLPDRVRDLTLAIQRNVQSQYLYTCQTGKQYAGRAFSNHPFSQRVDSCFMFAMRAIALDATCQFGRRPWRPLGIIALLGFFAALVLTAGMALTHHSRLVISYKTCEDNSRSIPLKVLVKRVYPPARQKFAYFRFASALTVAAVFNLPFKEVDVGQWLRMLSKREYEFHIRGWMRSFTGFVSLACFYLLALWVISFLGESLLG